MENNVFEIMEEYLGINSSSYKVFVLDDFRKIPKSGIFIIYNKNDKRFFVSETNNSYYYFNMFFNNLFIRFFDFDKDDYLIFFREEIDLKKRKQLYNVFYNYHLKNDKFLNKNMKKLK